MESQGAIAVRLRCATDYDKEFLAAYEDYEKRNESTGVLQKKKKQRSIKKRGEHGTDTITSLLEKKVKTFMEDGQKIEKV